jgi:hypothetical protein
MQSPLVTSINKLTQRPGHRPQTGEILREYMAGGCNENYYEGLAQIFAGFPKRRAFWCFYPFLGLCYFARLDLQLKRLIL